LGVTIYLQISCHAVPGRGRASDPVWLSPQRYMANVVQSCCLLSRFSNKVSRRKPLFLLTASPSHRRSIEQQQTRHDHRRPSGHHHAQFPEASLFRTPSSAPHGGCANTTVEKQRCETKKAELSAISISCRIAQPQRNKKSPQQAAEYWGSKADRQHAASCGECMGPSRDLGYYDD
jgi:hypothetical protein